MVGKLIKHELFALFRILLFFAVAVLLLAAVGRLLVYVMLNNEVDGNFVTSIIYLLVVIAYMLGIVALIAAAYAVGAYRFYKTMFTGEGYLTFSLPLTPVQLIVGKLASSMIAVIFSAGVSIVSLIIFMSGWSGSEMGVFYDVFGAFAEEISALASNDPWQIVEGVIQIIVAAPSVLLVIFAVISLGQLFVSHRKAITAALIIVVYVLYGIISSILSPHFAAMAENVSAHLSNCITIAIYLAVDFGSFFLIKYLVKNKLNLIV